MIVVGESLWRARVACLAMSGRTRGRGVRVRQRARAPWGLDRRSGSALSQRLPRRRCFYRFPSAVLRQPRSHDTKRRIRRAGAGEIAARRHDGRHYSPRPGRGTTQGRAAAFSRRGTVARRRERTAWAGSRSCLIAVGRGLLTDRATPPGRPGDRVAAIPRAGRRGGALRHGLTCSGRAETRRRALRACLSARGGGRQQPRSARGNSVRG